jgi:hypothetical protein
VMFSTLFYVTYYLSPNKGSKLVEETQFALLLYSLDLIGQWLSSFGDSISWGQCYKSRLHSPPRFSDSEAVPRNMHFQNESVEINLEQVSSDPCI